MTTTAVCALTAVAAALRFSGFAGVAPNPFYDAAVRSMGQSWHNFLYGAFEPGGQVSVDKPPVDLWLQVASTKVFGFSSVATRLPEALAGVLAVPLLYDLVRHLFGRRAGLGAAAALAVLPVAVLTARSDTMDSVMMLFDVLAAWLVVHGAQRGRTWPVVAAGVVMGVAFNVKLFEALIVLPALGVLAWLASDHPVRGRALAVAGGLAAFLAVSLAWVGAASLAPLGTRPWPIGSTNGSPWNVVFGFNGLDRLRLPASAAAMRLDPPGPLRLLGATGHNYGVLVGSTLLGALVFGTLALAVGLIFRRAARPRRLAFAGAAFLGTWLVVGVALLSHMQRMQPRYLEAVTPAIAAIIGAGTAHLAALAARHRQAAVVVALAVPAVALGTVVMVQPPTWAAAAAVIAAAGCAAVAVGGAGRPIAPAVTALALIAALAVPSVSALAVARSHASDAGLPSQIAPARLEALSRFLTAHQGHTSYEVASATVARVSPLIVRDGRPVLLLTSLYGRPLLTPARLAGLVAAGQVRYALLGKGTCLPRSVRPCAPVLHWARTHARDVSRATNVGPPGTLYALSVR